jgi:hypothetical protein
MRSTQTKTATKATPNKRLFSAPAAAAHLRRPTKKRRLSPPPARRDIPPRVELPAEMWCEVLSAWERSTPHPPTWRERCELRTVCRSWRDIPWHLPGAMVDEDDPRGLPCEVIERWARRGDSLRALVVAEGRPPASPSRPVGAVRMLGTPLDAGTAEMLATLPFFEALASVTISGVAGVTSIGVLLRVSDLPSLRELRLMGLKLKEEEEEEDEDEHLDRICSDDGAEDRVLAERRPLEMLSVTADECAFLGRLRRAACALEVDLKHDRSDESIPRAVERYAARTSACLRSLRLRGCDVTPRSLAAVVSPLHRLRSLTATSHAAEPRDDGEEGRHIPALLEALAASGCRLKALALNGWRGCRRMKAWMPLLADLPTLTSLNLSISGGVMQNAPCGLPGLRELSLCCRGTNTLAVADLVRSAARDMRSLRLECLRGLSQANFVSVASVCAPLCHLTRLEVEAEVPARCVANLRALLSLRMRAERPSWPDRWESGGAVCGSLRELEVAAATDVGEVAAAAGRLQLAFPSLTRLDLPDLFAATPHQVAELRRMVAGFSHLRRLRASRGGVVEVVWG